MLTVLKNFGIGLKIQLDYPCIKNFEALSDFIFKHTGDLLSKSTLRGIFQFNSTNKPTEATLDLICKAVGFAGWEDFNLKETFELEFEIAHYITLVRLNGIMDRPLLNRILSENHENPYLYSLLDAIIHVAITKRDNNFLKAFSRCSLYSKTQSISTKYIFCHIPW